MLHIKHRFSKLLSHSDKWTDRQKYRQMEKIFEGRTEKKENRSKQFERITFFTHTEMLYVCNLHDFEICSKNHKFKKFILFTWTHIHTHTHTDANIIQCMLIYRL